MIKPITTWAEYILGTDCQDCFSDADSVYHLRSVYLAYVDGSVYISGTKGDAISGDNNDPGTFPPAGYTEYRNLLYQVPANGTCAVESCARVRELPTQYVVDDNIPDYNRPVGVTALAAGTSGGNPFVAVGMTDYGTWIFDGDLQGSNAYVGQPTGGQTPVSALAFDPGGSGMLSVGWLSPGAHSQTTQVNPDGTVTGSSGYLSLGGGADLNPFPLSTTFGHRSDGSLVVAYGYNNGGILVGDPHVINGQALAGGTGPAGISVMDTVPRPDGGADDYATAMQTTSDITGPLIGNSWRWDESGLTFAQQQVGADAAGNPTTTLPDRDSYSDWFPGYKQGRFTITNSSQEEVTVSLETRPDPGYGCWWAGTWADAGPFPSDGLTLEAGQTTATDYVLGGYTAHVTTSGGGTCASSNASGAWRGYLVVTPTAHPADARIVNLKPGRNWQLDVSDQTGGSTTVTAQKTGQLGALGAWAITVDTPDPPTPVAPKGTPAGSPIGPTVTASVLTTSLVTRASVYRFDVTGMTWTVPTAPDTSKNPSQQTVLPAMLVEGLPAGGTTWQALGYLMPIGRPTGTGTTLTMATSTFYWENTKTANYSQIRVNAGSQPTPNLRGTTLAALTAPKPYTNPSITGITVVPTATVNSQNVAVPANNGVDQSTLLVTITAKGGTPLPSGDPAYQAVYYRSGGALITNLYSTGATNPTGNIGSFIGVQPQPGAVIPQSTRSTRGVGAVNGTAFNDYVSTTTTDSQTVTASVSLGATVTTGEAFTVDAAKLNPQGPGSGTQMNGTFSIEGCASDFSGGGTCRIANATGTAPALYQAGFDLSTGNPLTGLPLVGAQLRYTALTGQGSLPIEWPEALTGPSLSSIPVSVTNSQSQGSFSTTTFKPDDGVDIDVVTHGQVVKVTAEAGD